ncbi:MAG: hypothetical protein SPF22_07630 [Candidatus Onthovivens sp.]|nr:hypothetical protein [Candidatus Onthovivens sp.]
MLFSYYQWGQTTRNTSGDSSTHRTTFPISFSTAYTAIAEELLTSHHAMYGALWKSITNSYFDYNTDSDCAKLSWIAIGR